MFPKRTTFPSKESIATWKRSVCQGVSLQRYLFPSKASSFLCRRRMDLLPINLGVLWSQENLFLQYPLKSPLFNGILHQGWLIEVAILHRNFYPVVGSSNCLFLNKGFHSIHGEYFHNFSFCKYYWSFMTRNIPAEESRRVCMWPTWGFL